MADNDKQSHIYTIFSSFTRILRAKDELSFKNIRPQYLCYFLPLVIILTLLDQRNTYFIPLENDDFMSFDSSILVYASYCIGSLFVLIFCMKKLISGMRVFTGIALAGFMSWLFLPPGDSKVTAMMFFQFGLGGCAIYATYAYVFVLRNAERLFGIFLVTFNYGLFITLEQNGINNPFLSKILPAMLVGLLGLCTLFFRSREFPDTSPKESIQPPKEIYFVLVCPFAFFSINVFGEAVVNASAGSTGMRGIGAIVAVLLAFIIQFGLRRNIWHMLNLFLIFAITGIILLALPLTPGWFTLGNFLFGIGDGFGYIMVFYMTGLMKKYNNAALFWRITMATVVELIVSILITALIVRMWPAAMPAVTALLAAFFLFLFLLLSPVFQKILFNTDWIGDFHKIDMAPLDNQLKTLYTGNKPLPEDLFHDFIIRVKTLTPTERQIFDYYIEGKTAQEVLQLLYITMATLKAHNTHIFTKLNVTSKDALVLYIDLIRKSGLLFRLKQPVIEKSTL